MGVSEYWAPTRINLAPREGSGMLELSSSSPYNFSLHGSKGIAPGTFSSGDMATRIAMEWSGAIKRYTDLGEARCKWLPAEPQEGSFHVAFVVSEDTALAVQAFEREHVEDFERAWSTSFRLVAGMLRTCPPGSPQETVAALVNRLLDARAGDVIPAHPENLAEWGPRILDVYLALCKHSYRRDEQGQHSPAWRSVRGHLRQHPGELRLRADPSER